MLSNQFYCKSIPGGRALPKKTCLQLSIISFVRYIVQLYMHVLPWNNNKHLDKTHMMLVKIVTIGTEYKITLFQVCIHKMKLTN